MHKQPQHVVTLARQLAGTDASAEDVSRGLIEHAINAHGQRSAKAIASVSGLSVSTVYKYMRQGSTACRMQLPTFVALAKGAGKFYR